MTRPGPRTPILHWCMNTTERWEEESWVADGGCVWAYEYMCVSAPCRSSKGTWDIRLMVSGLKDVYYSRTLINWCKWVMLILRLRRSVSWGSNVLRFQHSAQSLGRSHETEKSQQCHCQSTICVWVCVWVCVCVFLTWNVTMTIIILWNVET